MSQEGKQADYGVCDAGTTGSASTAIFDLYCR